MDKDQTELLLLFMAYSSIFEKPFLSKQRRRQPVDVIKTRLTRRLMQDTPRKASKFANFDNFFRPPIMLTYFILCQF